MESSIYIYHDGLSSERLVTRFLSLDDIPAWSAFFKHKETVEFFPEYHSGDPMELSESFINRQMKRYADKRYGVQGLILKDSGILIGVCGLLAQEVEGKIETEVGYHVLKEHWGKGYAPEAAKMFISYGFSVSDVPSIISIIDRGNAKSERVAEKNGLSRWKEIVWNSLEVCVYRINRQEWISRNS